MRAIKDLNDVQIVLRELLDWKARMESKPWDLHGLRITNAAPGLNPNDVALVSQIPKISKPDSLVDQYYTQVFSSVGSDAVTVGDSIPAFTVGRGREGYPYEVHLYADTAPSGGPLTINLLRKGYDIDGMPLTPLELLDTSIVPLGLSLPDGENGPIVVSNFVTPLPYLAYKTIIIPEILEANGAAVVTIELVVKKTKITR